MNISHINSQLNTSRAYDLNVRRAAETADGGSISGSPVRQTTTDESQQLRQTPRHEESFGAYDYAKLYDPDKRFELKGRDSDPAQLDAAGTLGQMQKDELLGQYRSFASEAGLNTATAPSMRGRENFDL